MSGGNQPPGGDGTSLPGSESDIAPQRTETPTLKSRVFSGASWSFIDSAAQQLLSLVVFVVLGRILSPALFGIVSTSLVFVLFMRSTVLTSVSTGLVTLKQPVDEDYDTGFWLCVGIAAVAFVVLMLAAGPLARLYRIPEFTGVVRATSVIVLIAALSYAHIGWARRNFRFKALAMRNTISTLVGGGLGIGVALAGYGIAALVLNQVVTALVGLILLWRAIPWRPRFRFSGERARAILATAVPLGANQSLQFIAQNFDTALVTWLLGPVGGGLYAAAKRVVLAIQVAIWQPMASVALPAFAEVAREPVRFGNAAVRMGSVVMAMTAPLFAGIALTAPQSVAVLFGPKWTGAAPIMTVLAGVGLFTPSLGVLNQMVLALGRAKLILLTTIAQIALSVTALALVPVRDAVTIALCLTVPTIVMFMVTLALLARTPAFPLGRYLLGIGRPLLCVALMAVAVLLVPPLGAGPLVQLIVLAAVGGAVYAAALFVIARETIGEMTGFVTSLRAKRKAKG